MEVVSLFVQCPRTYLFDKVLLINFHGLSGGPVLGLEVGRVFMSHLLQEEEQQLIIILLEGEVAVELLK